MKRALFLALLAALPVNASVLHLSVNQMIHPISDEFIGRGLAQAERQGDQAVILEMSTPGGLLDSTRDIVEKIMTSRVPVIVYVAPAGSRAASAGFFILESADIAAMAPGTNTGAAHPVLLGQKVDDIMKEKTLSVLMDPNIVFLLLVIGALSIFAEFQHPGAVIPGVAGAISVLLALFALNLLPTQYASLVLLLAAFALFALEAKYAAHGILGIGGIICMVFGGLFLVD